MDTDTFLGLITAIGTLATPILVLYFSNRFAKNQEKERLIRDRDEKTREDRLKLYNDILEPFVVVLMSDAVFAHEKKYKGKSKTDVANEIMLSAEYRFAASRLSLIGDDEVVKAYNELMQYFYNRSSSSTTLSTTDEGKHLFGLFGNLLLEIRKAVGNPLTRLDNFQMLEWMITDIRKFRQ